MVTRGAKRRCGVENVTRGEKSEQTHIAYSLAANVVRDLHSKKLKLLL